jgi:hypothetical protein
MNRPARRSGSTKNIYECHRLLKKRNDKLAPADADHVIDRASRIVLVFAVLQFILHLWQCTAFPDPRLWPLHAVAYVQDLLLLGAALLLIKVLRRFAPERLSGTVSTLAAIILLAAGASLAVYPQLLREYIAFPINIFHADIGRSRALLVEYLGISRLWPSLIIVAVGVIALFIPFNLPAWKRANTVFWVIIAVLGAFTLPRSPNPWTYSLAQSAVDLVRQGSRLVPSLQRPVKEAKIVSPTEGVAVSVSESNKIDHIFLIVLEGVTSADFEKEFMNLKAGFYEEQKRHAVYFRNYHTTNLDSYTSLIAMLTSIQVPYRAYTDVSLYQPVNQTNNLTRSLHNAGFYTAFVSTYENQPFVPTQGDWDIISDRQSLPSLEGWISLGASRMESATEDRAALSTIAGWAAAHPKTFILHEMVYGHTTEWQARTGRSQLVYYNVYMQELLKDIETRGLADRSLFVIVSDHGNRALSASAENYRVPLLIVGPHVSSGIDAEFRSHRDLAGIIASYLSQTNLPPARTGQSEVGSTERWVYGTILANRDHLFIDDQTGRVLAQQGQLKATEVRDSFQSALDSFTARFGAD